MAHISQRRDLTEPHVATAFAAQMETLDALNMLLLLSYSDMKGVGPGVWSEWKGSLLWDLYERARLRMAGSERPRMTCEDCPNSEKRLWLPSKVSCR